MNDMGEEPIDEFDPDLDAIAGAPGHPTFRVTVLGDQVTLNTWWPGLLSGGAARAHFRARRDDGVAIADLRRWRNDDGTGELSVEFLSGGDRERAELVLEDWARLAGYSRAWFPHRMVDLAADGAPPLPTVEATCPTCWARWDDEAPEFWDYVRDSGCFPRTCLLCGGELPQWELAEAEGPAGGRPPKRAADNQTGRSPTTRSPT